MVNVIIIDDHHDRIDQWRSRYSNDPRVLLCENWNSIVLPDLEQKVVLATHILGHDVKNIYALICGLYDGLEDHNNVPVDHWLREIQGGQLMDLGKIVSKNRSCVGYLIFTDGGEEEFAKAYCGDLLSRIAQANSVKELIKPVGYTREAQELIDKFLKLGDCKVIFEGVYNKALEAKLKLLHLCLTPEGAKKVSNDFPKELESEKQIFWEKTLNDLNESISSIESKKYQKLKDWKVSELVTELATGDVEKNEYSDCFSDKYLTVLSALRDALLVGLEEVK